MGNVIPINPINDSEVSNYGYNFIVAFFNFTVFDPDPDCGVLYTNESNASIKYSDA